MNPLPLTDFSHHPALKDSFPAHFAAFIRQRQLKAGYANPHADFLADIAAFLAHTLQRGHVCLHLLHPPDFVTTDTSVPLLLPPLHELLQQLEAARGPCLSLNTENRETPLLLATNDSPRLYLQRYYRYEQSLESCLHARLRSFPKSLSLQIPKNTENTENTESLSPDFSPDSSVLHQLFPNYNKTAPTPQQTAIQRSLTSPLSIIAGGPGTGKTTVALQIIAAHLLTYSDCRIALAAPTGKAAVRMEESIAANLPRLQKNSLPAALAEQIGSLRSSTLHRLLGSRGHSPYFHYCQTNPLPVDLLIVDECSMIDLPLMAKLMDAVPSESHMVLLGDPHQLPSVEVGSVFGDILQAPPVKAVTTSLTRNYRAREAPEIVNLCEGIRSDSHSPQELLKSLSLQSKSLSLGSPSVIWHQLNRAKDLRQLLDHATERYQRALNPAKPPAEAFLASLEFRILTALRKGPFGMNLINDHLLARLSKQHQLLIVNRNDPVVGLFNGDMGLLPANDPNGRGWFPSTGLITRLRIPVYSPAYAMTAHRAQGSEFGEVHVVLPPAPSSPLLSREWLYTAISRARHQIHLYASEKALLQCLSTPTRRLSGLFIHKNRNLPNE